MGSPLVPVLANIFMGFYESKWLNEYNLNKPKFYLRYVDDILAAFGKEQDSLNFLDFLNKRHPNINFRGILKLTSTHLLLHSFLSSIIFIISTLIIDIFYCLNYTPLLLYLIITHLVVDFTITM